MPNSLPSGSGLLVKSGPARESGGTLYSNLADGKSIPVFPAVVSATGSRDFCLTTVLGNAALPKVVVPHRSFVITHTPVNGEVVFIGGLIFGEGPLPRANIAWPASNGNASGGNHANRLPPYPLRGVGTVSRVHPSGRFCEILEDRSGHRYFAHQSQFQQGARMTAGFRVTFTGAKTERGPAALEIKPQN